MTKLQLRLPEHGPKLDHPEHAAFPALDGMRALAVLMVVATHAAFWTGSYVHSPLRAPLARLDAGVAIFFVLSGFLLVQPWLRSAHDGTALPSNRVYFWRRALRILPLYWVTVVLALLVIDQKPALTVADWFRHAFLLQTFHLGWLRGGLTQTWSLCTEVSFYLILPLIGIAIVAHSRRVGWRPDLVLWGLGLLALSSVVWPYLIFGTDFGLRYTAFLWLPAYMSWFCGGMALAVVHVHVTGGELTPKWQRRWDVAVAMPGVWLATALALFALTCTPIAGPLGLATAAESTSAVVRSTLYAIAATMLVFPAVFCPTSRFFTLLSTPFARRMGELSYGVFLLHLVILQGIVNLFGWAPFSGSVLYLLVTTLIVSVAAAAVASKLIEEPARRLRPLVKGTARDTVA